MLRKYVTCPSLTILFSLILDMKSNIKIIIIEVIFKKNMNGWE